MAWKLTIDGTDRTALIYQPSGVSIQWTLNGRSTARFTCLPGLIPDPMDPVIIYAQDGTTPLFGGVVLPAGRSVQGISTASSQLLTQVQCGDYATYLDWGYISRTFGNDKLPDPIALLGVLQDIETTYLTPRYGMTLNDASVPDVDVASFAWADKRISDGLRELCERAGCVYRVTAANVLEFFTPGGTNAPVTITDADPHVYDLAWSDNSASDARPNSVTIKYGPQTPQEGYQEWAGDGVTETWVTDYADGVPTGVVEIIVDSTGAATQYSIGTRFLWTQATHTLTRGTAPIPAIGETIRLYGKIPYPLSATATTGATPVIEAVYARPDIVKPRAALEVATQMLAAIGPAAKDIHFWTWEHGFEPGQRVTVDLSARGLDVYALVTDVSVQIVSDSHWVYDVKATEQATVYRGSTLDEWRNMVGGYPGTGGVPFTVMSGGEPVITPPTPSTVLSSPFPLGGARERSVACGTSATTVIDHQTYEATASFSAVVRVECKLREGVTNKGVQPYLMNVTDNAVCGSLGTKVTATSWVSQDIAVTLASGKQYALCFVGDDAAIDAYVIGKLVTT